MPSTQEIVGHLQSANQKISDAMQVLQAAANSAGQMAQTQAGMGVTVKAGEYNQLKEAINKVAQSLNGTKQQAGQCVSQAHQIASGT
jgi:multidrug efflux pump subunit AcrB